MTGTHRGACRLCPRPVIWAVSAKGNPMPVDPQPSPDGNVELEYREDGPPVARVIRRDPAAPRTDLHLTHFVTCKGLKRRREQKR